MLFVLRLILCVSLGSAILIEVFRETASRMIYRGGWMAWVVIIGMFVAYPFRYITGKAKRKLWVLQTRRRIRQTTSAAVK